MKLLDIAKTIGAGVISAAVPGGPILMGVINELLPANNQLPATATGHDVQQAIDQLPPDQRAAVINKEFDISLEQIKQGGETARTMLVAEQNSTHTTRPYIAKGAFLVVAFCSLAVISTWCVGVLRGDVATVTAANSGADLVIYLLGPLVALLWAYFGILKKEQGQRLNAANSHPAGGVGALIGAIAKRVMR